jgi:glycosidase
MSRWPRLAAALAGALALVWSAASAAGSFRDRLPQDEIIYFVLPDRFENGDPRNDRGGIRGGRLDHGFDPTHKGFFHGGDLKGLTARLDYIQGLGATAIWLGPIYRNKPVQGPPGRESAGYHGYWILDFTRPDPHFGTEAELGALVEAAHARGMKVYLDIITNHTADVIRYRECPANDCVYRSKADYPWTRRRGDRGHPINGRFLGTAGEHQTAENFAELSDPAWAYTPYVPQGEARAKVPAWLNDPIFYHNRGETTFRGESSLYGDFAGLDDLMTSNPRVIAGMIEIFGGWIDRYRIDGFRIDTARHVNPEFWQAFVPAMQERAKANGIPHFHIFGEVFDPAPGMLATYTHRDGFPAVLDFAFQAAVADVVAGNESPARLAQLFQQDVNYRGGDAAALAMPTFLGNHDMGRFSFFVRQKNPEAPEEEQLARVKLAHAMLMLLRGVPTLYYGEEQGFVGEGGDQDARQTLFPSRVASYNATPLIGTQATTADSNWDTGHPLYRWIAGLAAVRAKDPALRRGLQRVIAYDPDKPGLFAVARRLPGGNRAPFIDTIIVFNTSAEPLRAHVEIDPRIDVTASRLGSCAQPSAPGSLPVELPPFGVMVCAGAVAVR